MSGSPESTPLLDQTQDAVTVLDENGVFWYANAAVERILGYEPDELVGTTAFEYIHDEDRAGVQGRFEEVISAGADGESASVTYRFRARDGSWVWLESRMAATTDPQLDGYVVSSRDVSDRVETERQHRKAESRLREIARTTSDVLWLTDGDWDELLFVNPAYEEVFGRPTEELKGDPESFLDVVHPDDAPAVEAAIDRLTSGERVDIEFRIHPESNYVRWVSVQGEPIREDGSVDRIVGFSRDVTERRRRERQMRVMDNLLRHNIRNQLNAVLANVELLAAGEADTGESLSVIRRASQRLLDSAEKHRDVVDALQSPQRRSVHDVAEVVDRVVESLRAEYPQASIDVSIPERMLVRAVDEVRLGVSELLENAIAHNDGGHVELRVRGEVSDRQATLVVRDNCPPLPAFDRRVLTGEHDTDTIYHSSGIGLWLVYWSVDLSEGYLGYRYDEADGGNVISLTLPRGDPDARVDQSAATGRDPPKR